MGGKGRCRSSNVPALEDECDWSQRQIWGCPSLPLWPPQCRVLPRVASLRWLYLFWLFLTKKAPLIKPEPDQEYILYSTKGRPIKIFQLKNLAFLTPQGSASGSASPDLESKISLYFTLRINRAEVSNYWKFSPSGDQRALVICNWLEERHQY